VNGKPFQINLERNDNQSGSILCGDKCVSMNLPSLPSFFMYTQSIGGGIAWKQRFEECFELLTCHYPNCCNFRDAQYKVKSQHYKLLFLIKKILPISQSSTHVRICVKDATPLVRSGAWKLTTSKNFGFQSAHKRIIRAVTSPVLLSDIVTNSLSIRIVKISVRNGWMPFWGKSRR